VIASSGEAPRTTLVTLVLASLQHLRQPPIVNEETTYNWAVDVVL
jgi:hypothetical protein